MVSRAHYQASYHSAALCAIEKVCAGHIGHPAPGVAGSLLDESGPGVEIYSNLQAQQVAQNMEGKWKSTCVCYNNSST